jgi:hypothetical protein
VAQQAPFYCVAVPDEESADIEEISRAATYARAAELVRSAGALAGINASLFTFTSNTVPG